jgi:polyhydroxyalkanoate synthesis repressor PhaR
MDNQLPRRRGRPPRITFTADTGCIIKKYGNRRLYDTKHGRYINHEALLDLIAAEESLRVVDAASGEDLTERVLAQAVFSEEASPETPVLPMPLLQALARFRGHERTALSQHLTEAVTVFLANHHRTPAAPDLTIKG